MGEAWPGGAAHELEPSTPPWSRLAIACLALPPALIAVLQLGRLHPDEVYQVLEPANHFAFGKGWISWEWEEGLRNWALPGALGSLLELCRALGIKDPQLRRAVLELPQYALHALSLGAMYRLIRRYAGNAINAIPTVHELWLVLGVALMALYAPVLHFAGRTLSESISTSFLLWGLERADARRLRARSYVIAGVLLGLSVVVRYGSAVIALAAVLYVLASRRTREAGWIALGGAVIACSLGALDWASWGEPFHSLRAYLHYNVLSGEAAKAYGREPASFYGWWLLKGPPPWFWVAALIGLVYARRRRVVVSGLFVVCVLAYLAAIFATAHKEERFLYPALVLALAAVVPALVTALSGLPRTLAAPALALALASGLVLLADPTNRFSPRATEQFRLFVKGVRTGKGVILTKSGKWGAPGYFYAAGRPWRLCDSPSDGCTRSLLKNKKFNRVVAFKLDGARTLRARGFDILEQQGNFTLWGR